MGVARAARAVLAAVGTELLTLLLLVGTELLTEVAAAAVVAEMARRTFLLTAAQAAPALLSSSTPYQTKPYLRSKALHNGQCQRV